MRGALERVPWVREARFEADPDQVIVDYEAGNDRSVAPRRLAALRQAILDAVVLPGVRRTLGRRSPDP